jgi:hypothetical protein
VLLISLGQLAGLAARGKRVHEGKGKRKGKGKGQTSTTRLGKRKGQTSTTDSAEEPSV